MNRGLWGSYKGGPEYVLFHPSLTLLCPASLVSPCDCLHQGYASTSLLIIKLNCPCILYAVEEVEVALSDHANEGDSPKLVPRPTTLLVSLALA